VIAATGENVKDVCKAVAWLGADEIAIHDDCYIYRHSLDPKFVSYFFQSRPSKNKRPCLRRSRSSPAFLV
jgi:hypothetical protein